MSDRFKNGMEARLGILGDEENASAEDLILTTLEHQNRASALLAKKTTDRSTVLMFASKVPKKLCFSIYEVTK